jgi:hypothetical protein
MRTRLTFGTAGIGDAVGLMIGLARLVDVGVAWEASEKHRSAFAVEARRLKGHEASLGIAHHLDELPCP